MWKWPSNSINCCQTWSRDGRIATHVGSSYMTLSPGNEFHHGLIKTVSLWLDQGLKLDTFTLRSSQFGQGQATDFDEKPRHCCLHFRDRKMKISPFWFPWSRDTEIGLKAGIFRGLLEKKLPWPRVVPVAPPIVSALSFAPNQSDVCVNWNLPYFISGHCCLKTDEWVDSQTWVADLCFFRVKASPYLTPSTEAKCQHILHTIPALSKVSHSVTSY